MGRPTSRTYFAGAAILWAIGPGAPALAQSTDQIIALQAILAEKGCYRAGVDGIWGPVSKGALALILEAQRGETVPEADLAPTRQNMIAVRDSGMRCVQKPRTTQAPAASHGATREPEPGIIPRSVRSGTLDCPGPGCPLGPSDASGTGWGRELN